MSHLLFGEALQESDMLTQGLYEDKANNVLSVYLNDEALIQFSLMWVEKGQMHLWKNHKRNKNFLN